MENVGVGPGWRGRGLRRGRSAWEKVYCTAIRETYTAQNRPENDQLVQQYSLLGTVWVTMYLRFLNTLNRFKGNAGWSCEPCCKKTVLTAKTQISQRIVTLWSDSLLPPRSLAHRYGNRNGSCHTLKRWKVWSISLLVGEGWFLAFWLILKGTTFFRLGTTKLPRWHRHGQKRVPMTMTRARTDIYQVLGSSK